MVLLPPHHNNTPSLFHDAFRSFVRPSVRSLFHMLLLPTNATTFHLRPSPGPHQKKRAREMQRQCSRFICSSPPSPLCFMSYHPPPPPPVCALTAAGRGAVCVHQNDTAMHTSVRPPRRPAAWEGGCQGPLTIVLSLSIQLRTKYIIHV